MKTAGLTPGVESCRFQRTPNFISCEVRSLNSIGLTMLFVEMAELLTLVDLVVLGDAMVRRRFFTPEALVRFCADVRHKAASPAARAAAYVRRDVDSPMETRTSSASSTI